MRLWGAKSDEILNGIKTSYSVTPTSIEAEVRLGEKGEFMKVVMSNDGRIRPVDGRCHCRFWPPQLLHSRLQGDPSLLRVRSPSRSRRRRCGVDELTEEFLIYHSPERDKAGSWSDSQLRALKDLVTAGGMGYGFVGYLTDQDSANVVDLREHKTLMMTFAPEGVSVVARNPSSAQESMKRLQPFR